MSNREVVQALIAAIDDDDEQRARALLGPELVSHGALGDVHGPDGFIGIMLHNVRGAFPDAHVELVDAIEEGDLVSFRLDGRGIPRQGATVWQAGRQVDVVRSGGMSPSLGVPIGTTFLPAAEAVPGAESEVEIRGERVPAVVVKRPFWTRGTAGKGRAGKQAGG